VTVVARVIRAQLFGIQAFDPLVLGAAVVLLAMCAASARSLTFKSVGAAGPNIYLATFDGGSLEWRIWLNLSGGVDYFIYRPAPK